MKKYILILLSFCSFALKAQDTTKVNFSVIKQQRYDYVKDSIRRLVIVNAPGDTIKIDSVVSSIPFNKYQIGTETYDTNLDGKVDFPKVYGLVDSLASTFRKDQSYGASNGQALVWSNAAGKWVAGAAAGGSPGGSSGQVQYNSSSTFGGAGNVEIENGNLRLNTTTTPSTPAAGGAIVFSKDDGLFKNDLFTSNESGAFSLQKSIGTNNIVLVRSVGGVASLYQVNYTFAGQGTYQTQTFAATNEWTSTDKLESLVTVAATNAISSFRGTHNKWWRGNAPGLGGFRMRYKFGLATGVSTSTNRFFVGFSNSTGAATDVNPSVLGNIIGFGWDASDANIQFMYNDGTGTASKIDLGSNFVVPTTDRTNIYEIQLYSAPNGSEIKYYIKNFVNGVTASGTVNSNIPDKNIFLSPRSYYSAGGTSSVIGHAFYYFYCESDQ